MDFDDNIFQQIDLQKMCFYTYLASNWIHETHEFDIWQLLKSHWLQNLNKQEQY